MTPLENKTSVQEESKLFFLTGQKGFTLTELVVVVSITLMVTVTMYSAIFFFYRSNAYVIQSAGAVDSARHGLAIALSTIRESSYAEDGTYPISLVGTSSITFYSDIDKDGGIEKIKIYVLGDSLYQLITNATGSPPTYTGVAPATSTIATNLRNGTTTPVFNYYDSAGVVLSSTSTNISRIRDVGVTLLVDINPNRAPEIFTLTGNATLRNVRDDI